MYFEKKIRFDAFVMRKRTITSSSSINTRTKFIRFDYLCRSCCVLSVYGLSVTRSESLEMERGFYSIAVLCLLVYSCQGLDLTINRESHTKSGPLKICGVLTCEEDTNTSISDTTDKAHPDSIVVLKNISSMSVFKRVFSGTSGNAKDRRDVLVGSVTSTTPTQHRVANSRKIDADLDTEKATMRIEFLKQDDCTAEFTCQVRGLDPQGGEVVRSSSLVQQSGQTGDYVGGRSWMPAISLQLLSSLQQLITQSVNGLQRSMDDKFRGLHNDINEMEKDFTDRTGSLEYKIENMQKEFNSRTDAFENRNEDKINNNLNKLMQLDFKVSTELAQFRTEAKADIMDSLDTIRQRMRAEQREALGNISESFQRSLNNASYLLHSMESDFDFLRSYDRNNRDILKNQTDMIREMLTSGEVRGMCVVNDTSDLNKAPTCRRYMDVYRSTPYPHYIKLTDGVLNMEILCDTKTDGGGWIVIQRRTGRDVDFFRDWADYKNGFGDTSGDFWLGNDAIHNLTVRNRYELRIDMRVKNQDVFAHYTSFKIEAESDNYRLRLGSHSGTVRERPGSGLSYHNNQQFSTRDRDNDASSRNCALKYRGGWWYKSCYNSNLNGVWGLQGETSVRWDTGSGYVYPNFVEMKIRKL